MAEIRLKSTGTIKLFENDNTSSVTIASPASLAADRTITLPDASVTLASGTMLATDGSGASLTALNASELGSGTVPTARLGSGTASSSTVLYGDQTYKAEPGGGKVIQVVNGTNNSGIDTSSSTLSDTGLTAAITPVNSANKILVIVTQGGLRKMTGNTYGNTVLMRDINGAGFSQLDDIGGTAWGDTASTIRIGLACLASTFLDSPSATTECTYKTQFASGANIALISLQDNNSRSSITLIELDYS